MLTRTVSRLAERLRRLDVLGPGVAPDDQSDLGNASHSDEHHGQAAQDRSKQEADGLWVAKASLLPDDEPVAPPEGLNP